MSDSRAIVLKMSVRDADIVRQQLVAMGDQGARALERLDAAAKNAAGGSGAGGGAGGGFGGLRNVIGQAGFQVQDFAVQVQGGTSALTALSQQGSQLLGVFGPAGAIAGAALTVGILASKLIDLSGASERAAEAEKRHREALDASAQAYETAIERSERLTRARFAEAFGGIESRAEAERTNLRNLNRDLAAMEDRIAFQRDQMQGRGGGGAAQDNPVLRAERERIATEAERISTRLAEIDAERIRLQRMQQFGNVDGEMFGPPAPSARDLRATDPRPGRAEREMFDGIGAVRRTLAELTAEQDRYNQSVNLTEAGVERAGGVLTEYSRTQERLTMLLDAGLISEAEFGAEVERTSVRLAEQLEEVRRRGDGTNDVMRQLGFTFSSAFEDAISKGKSLREVLNGIASDIAKIIIRQQITTPLANAVGNVFSGSGGEGGLLSGVGNWITENIGSLIPGRAVGGPVSAGMPYIVGERGPELFVPGSNGGIVPNGAGGGMVFAPTYNIDARGTDPSIVQRLRAEMAIVSRAVFAEGMQQYERGRPLRARTA